MPVVHSFDPPERFVVGTVGEPGQRTFFLQARTGVRLLSVTAEKQQVAALAERLDELLDDLMRSTDSQLVIPAVAPLDSLDNAPLESPIEEQFRAGTMTLSWDGEAQRVGVEVFPFSEAAVITPDQLGEDRNDLNEPEPDELLVVRLSPALARTFVSRARTVLGAGRAQCPFCGEPVDPGGHLCVRANGFRRRDP